MSTTKTTRAHRKPFGPRRPKGRPRHQLDHAAIVEVATFVAMYAYRVNAAYLLGVDNATLGHWLTGRRAVPEKHMATIRAYLSEAVVRSSVLC